MTRQIDVLINIRQTGNLNNLSGQLSGLNPAGAAGAKGLNLAGSAMSALGKVAGAFSMAAATAQVISFANESLAAFGKFDKGMREVFTLLPNLTGQAKNEIESQVLEMSANIGRSTQEVTTALYESLSANVPQENVFSFLEVASDAAKGGVTDLNIVVDGLTSVINAYGLEVSEATKVSDVLFQTVKYGKVRFSELATDLSTVVPVAASLGIPLEEVGALLATITAQGTPTSVAATQIRSALLDLSKGGGKAAEAFKELTGISFQEFLAQGGTVQGAMSILAAEAERTGVNLTDFFGRIEGGQAALQSTGEAAALYASVFEQVTNSQGSTASAVAEFNGSLEGQQNITAATTEQLKILVGEGLAPTKMAFLELKQAVAEGLIAILDSGNQTATVMTTIAESASSPQQELEKLAAAYMEAQSAINDYPLVGLTEALGFTSIAGDLEQQIRDLAFAGLELETGLTDPALRANELYRALQEVYGSAVTLEAGVLSVQGVTLGFATDLYATAEATKVLADEERRAAAEAQDTADRRARSSQYSAEAREAAANMEINAANASYDAALMNATGLHDLAEAQDLVSGSVDDMADGIEGGAEAMTVAAMAAANQAAQMELLASGEREMSTTTQASITAAKMRAEASAQQAEADRIASEALQEHTNKMRDYYLAALNAEAGQGLYNEGLDQLGTHTVFVSDLTAEQAARLAALREEYAGVTSELNAYSIGTEGLLLSEEERAEKMAVLAEQAAALEQAMIPLNEVGGQYSETTTEATFNTQAVGNALLDAAANAGASQEEMALLGLSLGLVSEEAAEAALKSAILQGKLEGIAAAFNAGDLSAQEAASAMQEAITEVEKLDIALNPATNSVVALSGSQIALAAAMAEPINQTDVLLEKLGLLPSNTNVTVTADTSEAENKISSLEARLRQLGEGGSAGTASGGYQSNPDLPGRAAGGPVSTGQTYNVGERGTEMYSSPNYRALLTGGTFNPPENGMISPAGATSNIINNVAYNISGAADLATLQRAYTMTGRRNRW